MVILAMTRFETAVKVVRLVVEGDVNRLTALDLGSPDLSGFSVVFNAKHDVVVKGQACGQQVILNDIDWFNSLSCIKTYEGFRSLVEAAFMFGMPGLILSDTGQSVLAVAYATSSLKGTIKARFRTAECNRADPLDIPILSSGTLKRPELVAALIDLDRFGLRLLLGNVLLFATPEMLAAHAGVMESFSPHSGITITPNRSVTLHEKLRFSNSDYQDHISKPDGSLGLGDLLEYRPGECDWGLNGVGGGGLLSSSQFRAISAFGSDALKLGLGVPDGLVLCSAPLDFLSGFPLDDVDQDRLSYSKDIVAKMDVTEFVVIPELRLSQRLYRRAFSEHGVQGFVLGHECSDELVNSLPAEYWKLVANNPRVIGWAGYQFSVRYKHLADQALPRRLTPSDVRIIRESSDGFSPESLVRLGSWRGASESIKDIRDATKILIDLEPTVGWIDEYRVGSGAGELISHIDTCDMPGRIAVLSELLRKCGIESVVEEYLTESQWMFLTDVFDREAFDPYIGVMPDGAVVKLVSTDFNI